jgi:hypothetical protein
MIKRLLATILLLGAAAFGQTVVEPGLSLNNIFTGNNTFNGAVTFTSGLTLNGTALGTFTGTGPMVLGVAPTIAGLTVSGTALFTGTVSAANIEGIVYADSVAPIGGTDCGAHIVGADAVLGAVPGRIKVNQACGLTISTAPTINTYHALDFIQGGTWIQTAPITLKTGASINGIPSSVNEDVLSLTNQAVVIKQANSTNLTTMVSIDGANVEIHDIQLNGNNPTNPSTVCLSVDTSGGARDHMFIQASSFVECGSHDATITSTTTANQAQGGRLDRVAFNRSLNGDGLVIRNTTDFHINHSFFEQNSGNGLTTTNSVVWLIDSDSSNNNAAQVLANVDSDSSLAAFLHGGLFLFGNGFTAIASVGVCASGGSGSGSLPCENTQSNVVINGYNGTSCNILGNAFLMGNTFNTEASVTGNQIDGVRIIDSGSNMLLANKYISGTSTNLFKYGTHIGNVNAGCTAEPADTIIGPQYFNTYSVGPYLLANSTNQVTSTIGQFASSARKVIVGTLGGSCPTAGSIGATCTSAQINWDGQLPDNNYALSCSLVGTMTGQPHIVTLNRAVGGAGFSIQIAADTAAAANVSSTGEVDCFAERYP